jgi:hypothetical protein
MAGTSFPADDRIPGVMGRSAPHPPAIKIYLALNAAGLLIAVPLMALIAGGGGYSNLRLLLIGTTVLLGAAAGGAAIHLQFRPARERPIQKAILRPGCKQRLGLILGFAFLVFWCLTWLAPQNTGDAYQYLIGLYPLILCGMLVTGSALVLLVSETGAASLAWFEKYYREHRLAILVTLILVAVFALIALLTVHFKILSGFEPYWYGAGVPLLAGQIALAAMIGALALNLETLQKGRRLSPDLVLFALVWIVGGALWASRPVPASFWIIGPRLPNLEYYPFSDLITFDIGSQFALIGQGIYNQVFFDRALYMSFLVYLHSVGGQNYQQLMSIQAALFAVFPAVLFLIGTRLHSRTAGLILSALVILRGLNSLDASAWIDTATFKHMLTDFPAAIGVAVFLLLILNWLEAHQKRYAQLMWAGGALGLTSLLRPHVLLLMAGVLVLVVWLRRFQLRRGLVVAALSLLAFLVPVTPWMVLGPGSGSLLALYGQRIQDVIAQRYPQPAPTLPAIATESLGTPEISPTSVAPVAPIPVAQPPEPPADPGLPFAMDHYLHNLVTSALIFPDSPVFVSVREAVKQGEDFWLPRWGGEMTATAAGMLIINLALVAFGVGAASQRNGWRGWIPMAGMGIYLAANSLARTSGGRYLVPVDWILVIYFSIAVAELLDAAQSYVFGRSLRLAAPAPRGQPVAHTSGPAAASYVKRTGIFIRPFHSAAILISLLLIGGLVPLAGVIYPRRYAHVEPAALLKMIEPIAARVDPDTFLVQPDAVVLQGRALYPAFYRQGLGEPTRYAPYAARDYPRTVFMLIGPHGFVHVLVPGKAPSSLPHASDAIVLGCKFREQDYSMVSALLVVLPEESAVISRGPGAPIACPVPDPVCDTSGNCH